MPHVGNDIVDLKHPGSRGRSKDQRFVDRVLTCEEKRMLLSSSDPDTLLWAFWAAKETAFKAVSKMWPTISAAPRNYRVAPVTGGVPASGFPIAQAVVTTPETEVGVKFIIHGSFVHCIGSTHNEFKDLFYGQHAIDLTEDSQPEPVQESLFVRQIARQRLAQVLDVNIEDIRIERKVHGKTTGPPRVVSRGKRVPVNISLSHHGRFAAFAFLLE